MSIRTSVFFPPDYINFCNPQYMQSTFLFLLIFTNCLVLPHPYYIFCTDPNFTLDRDQSFQCKDISKITMDVNSQISITGMHKHVWETSWALTINHSTNFWRLTLKGLNICDIFLYAVWCTVQWMLIYFVLPMQVPAQWAASSGSVEPEHFQYCVWSWLHWKAVCSAQTTGDKKPLSASYNRKFE
jgi:hypothetical protein